ncbi:lymphocyte antigen 96 [Emydura macquarii macquarii]|uniref:lymphocyte antigen 96 n=1 Tax=Emydura macquarii macquarii TaxID=1129001 RepID=UPI00352A06BD
MFQLVFFTLFTFGFTASQGKEVICNTTDLELSYSFCDSVSHVFFFRIYPCFFSPGEWSATLFWIPRSDIIFLKGTLSVWYNAAKVLDSKHVVCHGFDDDYSFCGTLKGETMNTTIRLSGLRIKFLKGIYTIIIRGFSDHSEENLLICLNATMTIKEKMESFS